MINKILIIGKVPPPAGGVGVHLFRLMESLEADGFDFKFHDLRKNSKLQLVADICRHKTIHLHTSHSYFCFFITIFSILQRKNIILTYHGNLGRFGLFRNFIDKLSLRLATVGIVLNQQSYDQVSDMKGIILGSAFIPPKQIVPLPITLNDEVLKFRKRFFKVYSTNANAYAFDINGNEIYNITKLVKLFSNMPNVGLVVSDASGDYLNYFGNKNPCENVLIISDLHDFMSVLNLSDGSIRATSTDGDALSVKESIFLRKITYCSNVVSRPPGVRIFELDNFNSLKNMIETEIDDEYSFDFEVTNGYNQLKDIYTFYIED